MLPTYISAIDFLLLPIVLLILYGFGKYFRNKYYVPHTPYYTYFIPFLFLKVLGAVAFACIYQFYYGYGDTFRFYNMGVFFTDILKDSPEDFITVYFTGSTEYYTEKSYIYDFDFLYNPHLQNVVVARFSSFIGLFTGGSFLLISIGFSILSATGLWKLWQAFAGMFPKLIKPLGWCILFVPSIIFWGSGLIKDSLTIGALGWLMYGSWQLFYLKRKVALSVFIILLSSTLLYIIKAYILLSFLPALLLWIGARYYKKISNRQVRFLLAPFLLIMVGMVGVAINNIVTQYYEELTLESIASTAINQQASVKQYESGSVYDLGELDPSFTGILKKIPLAIATTLYRPLIWEVNSVVMLFSALENLVVLVFTFWVLFKTGFKNFFRLIFSNGMVGFCFLFAAVFSIGVGISSANFGTLVRYKLPGIPFYLIGLLLIYYYHTGKSPVETRSRALNRRNRFSAVPG